MSDPALTLILSGGGFWILSYVLIIIRSFKDKTYGMPVIACCMNLAWEFTFLFIHADLLPTPQRIVNAVWLPLNLIIFFTILRFGPTENKSLTARQFYLLVPLCLVLSFVIIIYAQRSSTYPVTSGYAQNFVMSFLFVYMLVARQSIRGQSLYIALAKMFGTLSISLLLLFIFTEFQSNTTVIMIMLYVSVFVLDMVYTVLIYRKICESGISPWARL